MRAAAAKARRAAPESPVTTAQIVARITDAVMQHRLAPGTKLAEEALGQFFDVSRTKVRQALFQLATNRIVTLQPGRGAFVTKPSVREARELFSARRAIERAITFDYVQNAGPSDIARLRKHVAREQEAISKHDLDLATRLFGEFHLLIAERGGNQVLTEILRELVSRTSLVILLYQPSHGVSCSSDEHSRLVDVFDKRDVSAAMQMMSEHLAHVEQELALRDEIVQTTDLIAALEGITSR